MVAKHVKGGPRAAFSLFTTCGDPVENRGIDIFYLFSYVYLTPALLLGSKTGWIAMAKRHAMSRKASKRSFTKNALRVHKKNKMTVMRGGIRA